MIIENVEALKSWLAKLLEPICDADPSALANYVVALVKKDKAEKELRALCADQLDVFLQKETTGFVDKLFECLTTKNYLGNLEPIREMKNEPKQAVPKAEEREEPGNAEEERDLRRRRSPREVLRNRADTNESRVRDDRRRDDRKRRDADRYGKSEAYRERYERRPGNARGRSYSRSRSRSRSGSRGKGGDKDHARGKEHRSKFDQERKDPEGYVPGCGSQLPLQTPPLLPLSSGTPALPSSVSVAAAPPPEGTAESWSQFFSNHSEGKSFGKSNSQKRRCRDYDEKGFCVRGDLCPFDHGADPLIVDDVTLPTMIPFPPPPGLPPPPPPRMPPPTMTEPPPNMPRMPLPPPPGIFPLPPGPPLVPSSAIDTGERPGTSLITTLAPPGVGPPLPAPVPTHPQYTLSEFPYEQEAYNPESPGITQYRHFIPRIQTQRPNLIGLTSGDMDPPNSRAANIVIQTEPSVSAASNSSVRYSSDQESRKRPLGASEGPAAKKPWMDRQNFNNQHKPGFQRKNHYGNTRLEVRKIPRDLNNITKLNEHFSKFGTIVNIQVVFGGDPEAALIQYTANDEARRAISSTEAVLNNRFIRVYWHRENAEQQQPQGQGPSQSPAIGPQHTAVHKVINRPHSPGSYVLNKMATKHRLGGGAPSKVDPVHPATEANQPLCTSASLQKGAYSSVMKTNSKTLGKTGKALEAQEALKKKQEALKLQQDMRRKRQEMVEKHIECQKALISKLEKNKKMKPEERARIMATLKDLTQKISQLKDEAKPAPNSAAKSAQPKTKIDAQKELLDAELDFHKKLSSGEDTTDLKRRLGQLQLEAARLGLIPAGRGKPAPGRGRARGRGRGLRGRGGGSHMVVDHRPRALAILGLSSQEKDELMPHFVKFGEIEELRDHDATSVVMTFKTRSDAENAANQGAKFKGRTLQMSWYKPKTPSVSTEPEEEESKEEESESCLLLPEEEEEDDDEEDEDESRSWRR